MDDGKLWRVKKAVDRGAEVNIYKTDKLSLKSGILGKAAKDGHLEIVQFLLESGADVHPEKAPEGVLPIHFATLWGNKKVVELLIAKGADINVPDDDGLTPMDFTSYNNDSYTPNAETARREIADLLRKHGGP